MNKIITYLLLCFTLSSFTQNVFSETIELATWEFNAIGGEESYTANSVAAGIEGSTSCIVGQGLTKKSWKKNGCTGIDHESNTLADAINLDEYISFTIIPSEGKSMDITEVYINSVSQNTLRTFSLFSNVNGFANGAQLHTFTQNGIENSNQEQVTIAGHNNLNNPVEFRLYIHGSNGVWETVGIGNADGNDLIVEGEVYNTAETTPPDSTDGSCINEETSYTLNSGGQNEQWMTIESGITLTPGKNYTLVIEADLTGSGIAEVGLKANNDIASATNWFSTSSNIDDNTNFITLSKNFEAVANLTKGDLYIKKEIAGASLVINNICLIEEVGESNPPENEEEQEQPEDQTGGEVFGPFTCYYFNDKNNSDNNFINILNAVDNKGLPKDSFYEIEVEGAIDVTLQSVDVADVYANNSGQVKSTSLASGADSANCDCTFTSVPNNPDNGEVPNPVESEICEPSDIAKTSPDPFKMGMNISRIENYGTMITHKNLFKLAKKWSTVPFENISNDAEVVTNNNIIRDGCNDNFILIQELIEHSGRDTYKNLRVQTLENGVATFGGIEFDVNGYPNNGLPKTLQVVRVDNNNNVIGNDPVVPPTKVGVATRFLTFSKEDGKVVLANGKTESVWSKATAALNVKGRYQIFYEGDGEIMVNNTIKGNGETFDLMGNGNISVFITDSEASNPVSNIRVYKINESHNKPNDCLVLERNDLEPGADFRDCTEDYVLNRTINLPAVSIENGYPNTGSKYYDAYIERLSEFPILRFMNLSRINNSTDVSVTPTEPGDYSDIVPEGHYTYSAEVLRYGSDCNPQKDGDNNVLVEACSNILGIPEDIEGEDKTCYLEFPFVKETAGPLSEVKDIHQAILNQTGKNVDIWFNIPHNANPEYIDHVGRFFRDNFTVAQDMKRVNIYLEYTNEFWNYKFKQINDISALAPADGYCRQGTAPSGLEIYCECNDDSNGNCDCNNSTKCAESSRVNYAIKSKETFRLFEQALQSAQNPNGPKLKRVLAGQLGNPEVLAHVLQFFNEDEFDVLSVSGYVHPHVYAYKDKETGEVIEVGRGKELGSTSTVQDIAGKTILSIEETWEPKMLEHKRMADCFNAEVMLYEGGQHVLNSNLDIPNPDGGRLDFTVHPDTMIAFQESPELDNILREWYNFLRDDAKVDGMLAYSLAMPPDAKHGSWGHLDNIFEEPCKNNKYRVLMEYTVPHNNPNEIDADFDGKPDALHQQICEDDFYKLSLIKKVINFKIYPNPFSNNLTLQTEKENGTMRIVDMTGRILLQQEVEGKTTTIDTKTLKPGYYLIEIESGGETQTQKIIKY